MRPSRCATYDCAQKHPLRTPIPASYPRTAATSAWGVDPMLKATTPTRSSSGEPSSAAVDGETGHLAQAFERVRRERRLVRARLSIPAAINVSAATAMATAPITLGLPASSRSGSAAQYHVGRRDDLDRAASLMLRRPLQERVLPTDQRTGPERRVHLVRRQHDVVEMLRVVRALDVDAPMWGELRGVDKNPRPDRVRLSRQTVNGLNEAGDVRGAADRQQRDPLSYRASNRSTSSSSSLPSRVTVALTICARRRQGRSLEWCSMTVERMTASGSKG